MFYHVNALSCNLLQYLLFSNISQQVLRLNNVFKKCLNIAYTFYVHIEEEMTVNIVLHTFEQIRDFAGLVQYLETIKIGDIFLGRISVTW